jgi:hypothetical protein
MPNGVEDRDADCWEALLAVADLAGGSWANAARVTAVTLVTASKRRPPSIGVLLLRDVKKVFDDKGADRLPTEDILSSLNKIPESPWPSIRKGEPIDDRGLALRLRKYGIGSKALRDGEIVFKGYSRAQFTDAWKRYVDGLIDDEQDQQDDECAYQETVTSVTARTGQLFATDVTDVTASGQPHPERNGYEWHGAGVNPYEEYR